MVELWWGGQLVGSRSWHWRANFGGLLGEGNEMHHMMTTWGKGSCNALTFPMFVKPKRWYFNYFVCGQIPEEAPKKWRSRINGTRSQRPISNDEAKAQMGELLAAEDSGLECGTSKGDWRKAQHTPSRYKPMYYFTRMYHYRTLIIERRANYWAPLNILSYRYNILGTALIVKRLLNVLSYRCNILSAALMIERLLNILSCRSNIMSAAIIISGALNTLERQLNILSRRLIIRAALNILDNYWH